MNSLNVKYAFIMILAVFAGGCETVNTQDAAPKVKYVFLFIGDGMGVNHKALTESALQSKQPGVRLVMNSLPVNGKAITLNSLKTVTDSAAAGTAIACGVKTTNGKLGLAPDGNKVTSIAVIAKEKGMKVGIISSTAINDATPASFYAHVDARGKFKDIVADMASSGFDFFGGGKIAISQPDTPEADYYQKLKTAGYTILDGQSGLQAATGSKCYAQVSPSWVIDTKDVSALAEYTLKASELLDNPNGFFIMAEGAKIDHASHGNDSGAMVNELLAFDNAVNVGMSFLKKHPDNTLIVITSDHETGGLVLNGNLKSKNCLILNQKASYDSILNNLKKIKIADSNFEQAFNLVKESLGFDNFTPSELADLKSLWGSEEKPGQRSKYNRFLSLTFKIRDANCGVNWTLTGHSAAQVATVAAGKGQELFAGTYENTYIFANLKQLISGCPP
jgi:alkaline phosphatase